MVGFDTGKYFFHTLMICSDLLWLAFPSLPFPAGRNICAHQFSLLQCCSAAGFRSPAILADLSSHVLAWHGTKELETHLVLAIHNWWLQRKLFVDRLVRGIDSV